MPPQLWPAHRWQYAAAAAATEAESPGLLHYSWLMHVPELAGAECEAEQPGRGLQLGLPVPYLRLHLNACLPDPTKTAQETMHTLFVHQMNCADIMHCVDHSASIWSRGVIGMWPADATRNNNESSVSAGMPYERARSRTRP